MMSADEKFALSLDWLNSEKKLISTDSKLRPEEKLEKLKCDFELGSCCQKCVVDYPARNKGEYSMIDCHYFRGGTEISFTRHNECSRNWILAKRTKRAMDTDDWFKDSWFHIRPWPDDISEKTGPSGEFSICTYGIDDGLCVTEKEECSFRDDCPFAHSNVEYEFWTRMVDLKLRYAEFRRIILHAIALYSKKQRDANPSWAFESSECPLRKTKYMMGEFTGGIEKHVKLL